ncbi:methylenetetrahydrofolate reductase [Spirochaetia bacterium]|nr:methylenetetrahydrofolate reductase [Spirochaetia bacterium]GHV74532.1 methylenetetrahydrofolate reductase [Spirochaetia bacterium]
MAKVSDILKKKKHTFSFEVFPPKEADGVPKLQKELDQLFQLDPDFISCTYGAMGTNVGESKAICKYIVDHKVNCVTHFTVIGKTSAQLKAIFKEYVDMGVDNGLAMRGDFQKDPATGDIKTSTDGEFQHANELIGFLHKEFPNVCLAGAGYPERHLLAPSLESDIKYLKMKQDAGAELIMCQTCHDVVAYEKWIAMARKAGVTIPIVIGIMPILNRRNAIDMTIPGCIPVELSRIVGQYSPPPPPPKTASEDVQNQYKALEKKYAAEFEKYGMEYTINEVKQYLKTDLQGVHFYALNKAEKVAQIVHDGDLKTLCTK